MARKTQGRSTRVSKWYKADDENTHFMRRQRTPKPTALKSSIAPGQVLILLAGRFRGKRVVFLKQLKSGLLLVTGPFKINGVPLKRVNQAYVQATTTKVSLQGVDVSAVEDSRFVRPVVKKAKKSEDAFFANNATELSEEDKKKADERKKANVQLQAQVDKALLANIKKVELLGKYLSSRFTIGNQTKVHELVF